ncbi:MAG: hypothetical protein Ct9H90mP3_4260 [Flammeovirgaceae bacterium]|nr:MAG: hypothetical protein Ct9H90mP3_4260 [Flammeovirgaceae bacterium]
MKVLLIVLMNGMTLFLRGYSSVINGAFSFEFTVPVNIDYNFDKGRINLFATDTISFKKRLIILI